MLVVGGGAAPAVLASGVTASASGSDFTAYVVDSGDGTITPIDVGAGVAYPQVTVGSPISTPWAVAFSSDGETAYVVLDLPFAPNGQVVPVNVGTDAVGAAVAVGARPWDIAITPDGRTAYVTNFASSSVTPIDLADDTAKAPIMLPAGSGPRGIAITPDGSTAYVADYSTSQVTPIKLSTGTVEPAISVGAEPTALAVTPSGSFVDVVDYGDGTVTPIATATDTAGSPIPVGHNPSAITLAPSGTTAYVCDDSDGGFTPLNLVTQQAGAEVVGIAPEPKGIAITPDGSTAYISDYLNEQVDRVTLASGTRQPPLPVGALPAAIAVDPVGGILPPAPPAMSTGATTTTVPTTTVAPPTTTVPLKVATPHVAILTGGAKVLSRHFKLKLSCTGAACKGTVALSATLVVSTGKGRKKRTHTQSVNVAKATYSIAKNHDKTIRLGVTRKVMKRLGKLRTHPIRLKATVTLRGGRAATRTVLLS
jgi:YVTN family beta-propeller protein